MLRCVTIHLSEIRGYVVSGSGSTQSYTDIRERITEVDLRAYSEVLVMARVCLASDV